MKKEELKLGDVVKAIFRKYGKHKVIGIVDEIFTNEHAFAGDWVGIKVVGGNMKDIQVAWMVHDKVGCLVPINDVVEILK